MQVSFGKTGISLSQSHYIKSLLDTWGYSDSRALETPYDYNNRLKPNDGAMVRQLDYSKLIGSLMYAMVCTRPDIAFTVGMLCRFTSNPGQDHWNALDRLMRYLKHTQQYALTYIGHPSVLEGYSDASWCSELNDSKSTSGFVFTLGGAAVAWKSKRQSCIALSSMESELYALASAGEEAEWLRDLVMDIPLTSLKMSSVSVYCDNQATKTIATNTLFNGKRRQLRLKQSWLTSLTSQGIMSLVDVRSKDNVADALTKGLNRALTIKTSGEMGLKFIEI